MKPEFRRAELTDVIFMARISKAAYAKYGTIYGIAFDMESTLETIDHVVRNGICIVGSASCAGAMLFPFPYNKNAVIAYVSFWNFEKPKEIVIFDALVNACRETGATHINPNSLFPKNLIAKFYAKRKMPAVEIQYLAPIN